MRLRARLKRLRAEVEWLKWWGVLRACELQMEILARTRELEALQAASAKKTAREKPARREQPKPAAPVPANEPVPPPEPKQAEPGRSAQVFNGDPPEHMQIRPVRWRTRSPQDDLDDDMEDQPHDEDYDVLDDW